MSPVQRGATALAPTRHRRCAPRVRVLRRRFSQFSQLADEHAGIVLGESKRNLVYSRLSRRLRTLKLTVSEIPRVPGREQSGKSRISSTRSRPTTRSSSASAPLRPFPHPCGEPFAQRGNTPAGACDWSAGCSSGEEPYTIGAVLAQMPESAHDITYPGDGYRHRHYRQGRARRISDEHLRGGPGRYRYFQPVAGARPERGSERGISRDDRIPPAQPARAWPFKGLFDAIFCRNVMIYFDGRPSHTRRAFHAAAQAGRLALYRSF